MEFEFKDMTCKCGSNKFATMKKGVKQDYIVLVVVNG